VAYLLAKVGGWQRKRICSIYLRMNIRFHVKVAISFWEITWGISWFASVYPHHGNKTLQNMVECASPPSFTKQVLKATCVHILNQTKACMKASTLSYRKRSNRSWTDTCVHTGVIYCSHLISNQLCFLQQHQSYLSYISHKHMFPILPEKQQLSRTTTSTNLSVVLEQKKQPQILRITRPISF
jgi:hypothetical protein